ncbi:MAG TPA: hypothetical protein VHD90_15100 [Phototrophicaceae bacterium]|nr:hypothetical protein [Phototrophicaceae bacterium]
MATPDTNAPIQDLVNSGLNPRLVERLQDMNINTVGDALALNPAQESRQFPDDLRQAVLAALQKAGYLS